MLHRIEKDRPSGFSPNSILSVSPQFLEETIRHVLDENMDIIPISEVPERLKHNSGKRRFACFTFDDGYRDNLKLAYPIFKKYNVPFTIYVPSDYAEGEGELWWVALEHLIANSEEIDCEIYGEMRHWTCWTTHQKYEAFSSLYWYFRSINEARMRTIIRDMCEEAQLDISSVYADLIMTSDEIYKLAQDPLVSIGGHTVSHSAIANLDKDHAIFEILNGSRKLEANLHMKIETFSYPYGNQESAGPRDFELVKQCGIKTAVTSRKGLVFREHVDHLTALPRVSLNGNYQSIRYVKTYLSGLPFFIFNRFRKLDVN